MLKILRHKKTAKKVWIGLALIIIPAFALWGFGSGLDGNEDNKTLGKISGRKISYLEFRDALSAVTTTAVMRFGDKLPEMQKELNLDAQAWERLILLEEAKRRGIKANDKEVTDLITSLPYFQHNGAFDNKIYNQTLQYVFRIKARAFEEQTRQNLMLSKLYQQVTAGLKVEEKEIEQEYIKANNIKSILGKDEKKYLAAKSGFAENLLNQKKEEKFMQFMLELNKKVELK